MLRPIVGATLATILSVFVVADAGAALSQRTFVASHGSDVNPCSLALPCRSFNAAIAQTSAGGEVVVLDTAGYGPMTITQSIKIIGPAGVYGGVSVLGSTNPTVGVTINAGATDEITLRGLDIAGVPGAGPLPNFGIDIQNAAAVHIEKSSISNFTQDTSACVHVNVATTVRVYLVDSFLRECRTGIYANGSAVVGNRPSVMVDNARIERGTNTGGGAAVTIGVWIQGFMDMLLRNSTISRETVGIQFDGLLPASTSHLELVGSTLARNTTGIAFSNATATANGKIDITGSQIDLSGDAIMMSVSATGTHTALSLIDSKVAHTSSSGITLANTAADTNSFLEMQMTRSGITQTGTIALDLSAFNGGRTSAILMDSAIYNVNAGIKTSGSGGYVAASIVRSALDSTSNAAIDHGFGCIRLDSSHVVFNNKDFVNSGSGCIVSSGTNMVHDNADPAGPVYITPTKILLE